MKVYEVHKTISFAGSLPFFTVLILFACNHTESQKPKSGNPIAKGWYADPEAIIIRDTCWIFPTYSAAYKEQVFLDAFSSSDLVNWQKHEKIIDTSAVKWAYMAMWAPCMVEKRW